MALTCGITASSTVHRTYDHHIPLITTTEEKATTCEVPM